MPTYRKCVCGVLLVVVLGVEQGHECKAPPYQQNFAWLQSAWVPHPHHTVESGTPKPNLPPYNSPGISAGLSADRYVRGHFPSNAIIVVDNSTGAVTYRTTSG